jgi:hypothetical protein
MTIVRRWCMCGVKMAINALAWSLFSGLLLIRVFKDDTSGVETMPRIHLCMACMSCELPEGFNSFSSICRRMSASS